MSPPLLLCRTAASRPRRRRAFRALSFSLFFAMALAALPGESRADETTCARLQPSVTVVADGRSDAETACVGAARALAFLAERGITASRPIDIRVVDRIDALNGAPVAGSYNRRTKVVKVLARDAFETSTTGASLLTLEMDDDLHASLFAHEVTHAVIDQYASGREVSPAAHEYVAYAVQLSTLPAAVRKRLLAKFPGTGFTAPEQINTVILGLDPHRFAAKAYRHFRGADHEAETLKDILAMTPPAIDLLD